MLKIKEYIRPASLEEAYELNQKKNARIIGGMLWLKMMTVNTSVAIDLSDLGLDQIEETEEEYRIGCMVTLRDLELHEGLNQMTGGMVRESVEHIVGVQLRNLATVGGTIFGRFGFSDVLTCFLALDSYVELYKGGIISMNEFVHMKRDRDILVRVIVKKHEMKGSYQSQRTTKTDFPTLTTAVAVWDDQVRIAVGARPGMAKLLELTEEQKVRILSGGCSDAQAGNTAEVCYLDQAKKIAGELCLQADTQSNFKASAEYRTHLAKVFIKRGILAVQKGE